MIKFVWQAASFIIQAWMFTLYGESSAVTLVTYHPKKNIFGHFPKYCFGLFLDTDPESTHTGHWSRFAGTWGIWMVNSQTNPSHDLRSNCQTIQTCLLTLTKDLVHLVRTWHNQCLWGGSRSVVSRFPAVWPLLRSLRKLGGTSERCDAANLNGMTMDNALDLVSASQTWSTSIILSAFGFSFWLCDLMELTLTGFKKNAYDSDFAPPKCYCTWYQRPSLTDSHR